MTLNPGLNKDLQTSGSLATEAKQDAIISVLTTFSKKDTFHFKKYFQFQNSISLSLDGLYIYI